MYAGRISSWHRRKFDWVLPDGVKEECLNMNETIGLASHRKISVLALATNFFSVASNHFKI